MLSNILRGDMTFMSSTDDLLRLRSRGEMYMVGGDIESGVAGAAFHDELLRPEAAEVALYVPQRLHQLLASVVAAVDDPLGSVALDLMDSGDPHRWVAAENLVNVDG